MKTLILSWLLYHSNTGVKSSYFYKIKNNVIQKYGIYTGYDIQHLEGKRCYSCSGSGIYHGYRGSDMCYNCCGTGLYRDDRLVCLKKYSFGKYEFHQPINSIAVKPDNSKIKHAAIKGYIVHEKTKYCSFSRFFLFLMYEKNYLKRWWRETGNGWRVKTFYSAENFIYNFVHILKKGKNSYPINRVVEKFRKNKKHQHTITSEDDLPF